VERTNTLAYFDQMMKKSFIPFVQGNGTLAYLVHRQLLIKTLCCKGQNTLAYFDQMMKNVLYHLAKGMAL
jgi:hypothetical protein